MSKETQTSNGNTQSAGTVGDFLLSLADDKQMPTGGERSLAGFDGVLPIGIDSVELKPKKEPEAEEGKETVAELQQRIKKLESDLKAANSGYSGSSAEARRLRAELDDLRDEVKEQIATRKENEKTPKDLFEALGIEKDSFVMDLDEALKNPESDSYKVYHAQIALEAARQIRLERERAYTEQNQSELARQFESEKQELMKENNWTDEDFEEWLNTKGKDVRLTLKNAFLLTNQNKIVENAIKNMRAQKTEQTGAVKRIPPTMASQRGGQRPSASQTFQDAISKVQGVDLSRL